MMRHRLGLHPIAILCEGAGAGVVATLAMTAVTVGAQAAGLLSRQPPARITAAFLDALGVRQRPDILQRALTTALHLGFGASVGAVFGLLHRSLRPPLAPALQGAIYGVLVWAASYAGWIPALGILPPPTRDRPGRPITMVLAHAVYGVTLGMIVGRRARRPVANFGAVPGKGTWLDAGICNRAR
ncbi:MAG TPA: DUF6789 family protein [Chloroflexota bacterium]|nr:DUF6789 family protein [Chloroflexota bacterium]